MVFKEYVIGKKTYFQKELSFGQGSAFLEQFEGVDFGGHQLALVRRLAKKMPSLAAIILIPKGMPLVEFEEKLETPGWVQAQEARFKTELGFAKGVMIARDFLRCNDIPSLIQDLAGMMADLNDERPAKATGSTSTNSAPSLAVETQAKDTPSVV